MEVYDAQLEKQFKVDVIEYEKVMSLDNYVLQIIMKHFTVIAPHNR